MELNKAAVFLRKRSHWQAMDLGLLLGRIWFVPLSTLSLLSFLPFFLLAALYFFFAAEPSIWWVWFLFWLFAPLSESVLIIWISRAFFGVQLKCREVFSLWREKLSFSFLLSLFRGRFSAYRAFAYSILILEGGNGRARKKRLSVFTKKQQSGFFLYCSLLLLHLIFIFSVVTAVDFILPKDFMPFPFKSYAFNGGQWISLLLYFFCAVILTPFSVSCGFMLYISSRIELEGWDIEIGFRNLNMRLKKGGSQ